MTSQPVPLGELHPALRPTSSFSEASSLSQGGEYADTSYNSNSFYSRQQRHVSTESRDDALLHQSNSTPEPAPSTYDGSKDPTFYPEVTRYESSSYVPKTPIRGPSRRWVWPWSRSWRWHSSWNMYLFFVFGLVCAGAHHAYYSALNGKPVDDQLQMLRYGTFLAFAAKAGLSAAVVVAFRQRVWTTIRTRLMTVAALDSLFAATEDFTALWNWELIRTARTAIALAVFVWIAPLVVILTANTLLVEPTTILTKTTCPGIRTLNFTFEETNDWRQPTRIGPLFEIPVSLWNTTKPPGTENPPDGWFDYYTAPAPSFQQTATIGAYLGQAVDRKNGSMEICGSGWNCTFSIDFTAPGYKCVDLLDASGQVTNLTQQSGQIAPPFNTSILLPNGPYSYYAFTSGGEYSTTQMKDVGIGGIPNTKPPYPTHLGAFRTEPVVWIGYSVITDANADASNASSFVPKMFACEHYETKYSVVFNHTDRDQLTKVTNRTFLAPIINTTYIPSIDADDGTQDNVTAVPEENYIYPSDVQRYRRTAAYHSLGFVLREFLNGTVEMNPKDHTLVNPTVNTFAIQTKLLDPRNNYFPYPNLPDLVQELYEDMIFSILSKPEFVEVVWASKPDQQSGADVLQPGDFLYPCTKSRMMNVYSYHVRDLWIVYGISILLTLAAIVAGLWAMNEEGAKVPRDTRFSSIVAATRGPALDKVDWGERIKNNHGNIITGEDDTASLLPREKRVERLKVAYGLLDLQAGVGSGGISSGLDEQIRNRPRYGFGLEEDVLQPEKLRP
ncbi:hypothetical protein QBC46DRAFT_377542 [Diplogelasinospora grovesii]|uniref:Formylmethionine deformylase-like protein n=1 Tax=Diplogelasinospora grovesii TaxID=303347 RepID=A0AAN6NCM4_9PEZI|nr:hypothetical protein QBC46DRAFT_377542 [Diplogelasinospora grovesii]